MPKACRLLAIALSLPILCAGEAAADSPGMPGVMTMPGERCTVEAKPEWSAAEKWAWGKICVGEIADMVEFAPGPDDPKKDDTWPDGRDISARFLDTVLLLEPYRSTIPNLGVTIQHAHFADYIDLSEASLIRTLWLEKSRFDQGVNLSTLHSTRLLGLDGSRFNEKVNLQRAEIDGSVFMRNVLARNEITMTAAKIGSSLTLDDSIVSGDLGLDRMTTGSGVFLARIQAKNVDLSDAHIGDRVELTDSTIANLLDIDRITTADSVFLNGTQAATLDVSGAHIGFQLNLDGVHITGNTSLQSVSVSGALFATTQKDRGRNPTQFDGNLDMLGAHIGGGAEFDGAQIHGELILEQASVGGNLWLAGSAGNRGDFGEITMPSARIGAALLIHQADFHKPVRINDVQFGQNVKLSDGVRFFDLVQMIRTKVDGDIQIADTTFNGPVDMHAIQIGSNIQMDEKTQFDKDLNLAFAHIGGNLDLTYGTFSTVDLTGATIVSEIRLGTPTSTSPNWHSPFKLTLRNVFAGALQDLPKSRPKELDLEGFTYSRIGGFGAPVNNLGERDASDFTEWLAQENPYSPQSYIQLATVFRNSGYPDKADWILFQGRLREMFDTLNLKKGARPDRFFFLFIYCITTGFGIYPQLATVWVVLFVVLGAWIFGRDKEPALVQMNRIDRAIYSLDMLIPVVHLRGKNYTFEPKSSHIRYYLYVHRFIGFLLATVLIASLSHGSVEFH